MSGSSRDAAAVRGASSHRFSSNRCKRYEPLLAPRPRQPESHPSALLGKPVVPRAWILPEPPAQVTHPKLAIGIAEEEPRKQGARLPSIIRRGITLHVAVPYHTRRYRANVNARSCARGIVVVHEDLVDSRIGGVRDVDSRYRRSGQRGRR